MRNCKDEIFEMAHSFRGGGGAAVGTGTLPVGFQGRSALAAGGMNLPLTK